ncbi:MAG: ABC transporter substrate-binding protein, partial [Alphaproteobacteria bacterium]|nr:ABC transporter substrate-binding protein [Alphaproteobacteria bacterium]
TGWHEPSTTTELLISRKAMDGLPSDIQAIVRNVAAAANIIAHTSAEAQNGDALTDLVDNYGVKVRQLPDDVIAALRTKTAEVLSSTAAGDPLFAKVLKSFKDFQTKHDKWANSSERQYAVRVRGG